MPSSASGVSSGVMAYCVDMLLDGVAAEGEEANPSVRDAGGDEKEDIWSRTHTCRAARSVAAGALVTRSRSPVAALPLGVIAHERTRTARRSRSYPPLPSSSEVHLCIVRSPPLARPASSLPRSSAHSLTSARTGTHARRQGDTDDTRARRLSVPAPTLPVASARGAVTSHCELCTRGAAF